MGTDWADNSGHKVGQFNGLFGDGKIVAADSPYEGATEPNSGNVKIYVEHGSRAQRLHKDNTFTLSNLSVSNYCSSKG